MNPFDNDGLIACLHTNIVIPIEHLKSVLQVLGISTDGSEDEQFDRLWAHMDQLLWALGETGDGHLLLMATDDGADLKITETLAPYMVDGSFILCWDHASDMPCRRVILDGKVIDHVGQVTWVKVTP